MIVPDYSISHIHTLYTLILCSVLYIVLTKERERFLQTFKKLVLPLLSDAEGHKELSRI